MRCLWTALLLAMMLPLSAALAEAAPKVRIGILEFGTVAWEMDVVKHHGLAEEAGVELEVVPLSSTNALSAALQSGKVDIMVGDWIWVSRQRSVGRNYTLFPYSLAVGDLVVDPKSGIDRIEELKGEKLGVAGGVLDKSWLMLQAYARRMLDLEMDEYTQPAFAAPPLLNDMMMQGRIPAVLNYWHYTARLKAAGMESLITVEEMLSGMDVEEPVPLLGFIFNELWAEENTEALHAVLQASYEAKRILAESDEEWRRIRPQVMAEDEATLEALRDSYRAGIPQCFGKRDVEAARKVFKILAEEGGRELVGHSTELSDGTFWREFEIAQCPR